MPISQNIDSAEVNKFNTLANQWWDLAGPFKTLHEINPLRLQFIKVHCPLKDKTVIDVGCGGGILSESLTSEGASVTGIDMAPDVIKAAKLHAQAQHLNINYQQIAAEEAAEKQPGVFDVVTCMELLEHVPDPASIVNACAELTKPGGAIFFSTINRNLKAYAMAVVCAEYVMNMLPKGTHDYEKFIRPSELEALARQAGLRVKALSGFTYNPLTRKYSLCDSVAVNYLVYAEKL